MYELFKLENCQTENGLKLLYASCFCAENPWRGTHHSHDFLEILFCIHGKCEIFVRNHSFFMKQNQFLIINPEVEHFESTIENTPVEWVVLAIQCNDIQLQNTSDGYYLGDLKNNYTPALQILSNLVNELQNKQTNSSQACMHLLQLLMIYISRASDIELTAQTTHSNKSPSNITWVKQFIRDNYTKPLNLDILSQKIGLNKYTLIREFKRTYHVSPIEYMLNCRYQEAKFLLETTDRSVSNIGLDLGFCSGNYFSQCFQKRFDISPSSYRKLYRQNEK